MSEMVERVIKAIMDEETSDPRQYEAMARAAIEAMREPTEDMKTCSDEIHWGYSCHVCGGLTDGWHKMIDAALKPEPAGVRPACDRLPYPEYPDGN